MKYNTIWLLIHSLILGVTLQQLWTQFPFNKTVRILSFYSNFNHLLVTIYLFWHTYIGLFAENRYSKAFFQYVQFVLASSIFVAVVFWLGYSFDARLFLGRNPPPSYLLYSLHGGTALLIMLEYRSLEDKIQILRDRGQWPLYALLVYQLIVAVNYIQSGRFPYPFQKKLNFWFNTACMLMIAAFIYGFYSKVSIFLANRIEQYNEESKLAADKKEQKTQIEVKKSEEKKEERKSSKKKSN